MNKTFETGNIIDMHRVAHTWSGRSGRTIECMCGHKSQALYEDQITPITDENNPERVTQRAHADHVAEVLQSYAEQEDPRRAVLERAREEIGYKPVTKAVKRSKATKYQVSAYDREYLHLVTADLLRRAAMEIGRHEEIPAQIMIDRAPVIGGEKITLTWFA